MRKIVGFVLLIAVLFFTAPRFIDALDGRFGGRWSLWTFIVFVPTYTALLMAYLLGTGLLRDLDAWLNKIS